MERVGWGGKGVMGRKGWNGRDGMNVMGGMGWEGCEGRVRNAGMA